MGTRTAVETTPLEVPCFSLGVLLTCSTAPATEALVEDAALEPEYVALKRGPAGVVIMKSDPPEGTMVNSRLIGLM